MKQWYVLYVLIYFYAVAYIAHEEKIINKQIKKSTFINGYFQRVFRVQSALKLPIATSCLKDLCASNPIY